jgi:hypothetical protein
VTNPTLPPSTPVTISSATGLTLGVNPQTGLLSFGSTVGDGPSSGATFALVNPLDPSATVKPGDTVVIRSSDGKYCAFRQTGGTRRLLEACDSLMGMDCTLDSPQQAVQLTYRWVSARRPCHLLSMPAPWLCLRCGHSPLTLAVGLQPRSSMGLSYQGVPLSAESGSGDLVASTNTSCVQAGTSSMLVAPGALAVAALPGCLSVSLPADLPSPCAATDQQQHMRLHQAVSQTLTCHLTAMLHKRLHLLCLQ